MTRQLLIDCSSTITCDFNSGIQRVVRGLCTQAMQSTRRGEIKAIPVQGYRQAWTPVKHLYPSATLVDTVCTSKFARRYRDALAQMFSRFPNRRLEKLLLPKPGHSGIFKLPRKVLDKIDKRRAKRTQLPPISLKVNPGDVLLRADATWMVPNHDAVKKCRENGVIVGSLIYDLIPITHPHFFPGELVDAFQSWFSVAIKQSDFFLCISEHVTSQVREQIDELGSSRFSAEQICHTFPLGSEVECDKQGGSVTESFGKLFSADPSRNPLFVVGTLEPRKNHGQILDAFDQHWSHGGQEKVCIVGRVGWNCESIVRRIESHVQFGKRLFLFNDASDADVRRGYERAKAVIMASHTEGFGLPIVEALRFGQRVLASETPIHREVGGDAALYFDLASDGRELARLISDPATYSQVKKHAIPQVKTWQDSYAAVVKRSLEMARLWESQSMLRAS